MKKNQLAAIIVGAVLITGSTVSISAASMGKSHHKSHSISASQKSGFLRGVVAGNSWAALHSVLNSEAKKDTPVAPIVAPPGILLSDTSTVTMPADDDGINEDSATNNEESATGDDQENSGDNQVAVIDDDTATIGVALPLPTPTTGITNPMTNNHGDSNGHSDHSQGDSNGHTDHSQGDSNQNSDQSQGDSND
jgi:hypothetical protein